MHGYKWPIKLYTHPADADALEAALDHEEPKGVLVDLVLAQVTSLIAAEAEAEEASSRGGLVTAAAHRKHRDSLREAQQVEAARFHTNQCAHMKCR